MMTIGASVEVIGPNQLGSLSIADLYASVFLIFHDWNINITSYVVKGYLKIIIEISN
jgi:hypothetical protein